MAKHRKMLQLNIPAIQEMMQVLLTQSKQTICNWAIDYAEEVVLPVWVKHRGEDARPQAAIAAAREWLDGKIKLPQAKVAIVACITAAREAEDDPAAQAAGRAIHQVSATIHMPSHSLGLPLYGALAVAYDALGIDAPWEKIEQRASVECERMLASLKAVAVENEPNPAKINWNC